MSELEVSVDQLRMDASAWCEAAVDGDNGVKFNNPVYQAVTEHRDPGPGYSSCGDLGHWLLYRMGVRSKWVNRQEHLGWKAGLNVSMLAFTCPVARAPRPGEVFHRGDIFIVWTKPQGTDAHVDVCDFFDVESKVSKSWDYGQATTNPVTWNPTMTEGCRRTNKLYTDAAGDWWIGARKLQKVLPLIEVLTYCKAHGELVPADNSVTWLAKVIATSTK